MAHKIRTIIKFMRGAEGINGGKIFGFVTKEGGSWKGCRKDDSCKKKIVLVDPSVEPTICENMPYNTLIIPMASNQGFIAISAKPIKFTAKIVTEVRKGVFRVIVKFGMKTIEYNPSSPLPQYTNITKIAERIRMRKDLEDAMQVAEDFINSACIVRDLYRHYNPGLNEKQYANQKR